jgi:hypothetical protein
MGIPLSRTRHRDAYGSGEMHQQRSQDASATFAAIDLGASGGGVVLGRLARGRVALEELQRFPNRPVQLPDGLRWNLRLEAASGREITTLHVIGGGARNMLLCRLTADITGREVLAGPVEATALGNVLVQARAAGELGSLADMRAVAAASAEPVHYEPSGDGEATYRRFLDVTGLAAPTEEISL